MSHINKQIVDLKHQIERIDVLRAEKKSLKEQIELKQIVIEDAKASIDMKDQQAEGLSFTLLFECFRKQKKDENEARNLRVILEIRKMENDLQVLQDDYDCIIDQLKENHDLDVAYKKLMEEKRLQVGNNQDEILSSLEAVIEKCRLENIRMNEAIRLGERVLIQLKELKNSYIHTSDQRVFESALSKKSKQYERLEDLQMHVAKIKRGLEQFESTCARCKVEAMNLNPSFVNVSDKIVDSYLMDFFFEDERKKLEKDVYQIERIIAGTQHDLEIRELTNQNKIIEMLDCINAL